MQQIIDQAIQKSISEVLPNIRQSVTMSFSEQMGSTIKTSKEQSVNNMTEDLKQKVKVNLERNNIILEMKVLSRNEQLENYNRRDDFKILGRAESTSDVNGKHATESTKTSMEKIIEVAQKIGAKVDMKNISIAHRLPNRASKVLIVVKFARRVRKVEMLIKKKKLLEYEKWRNSNIMKDIKNARLKFLSLMRPDGKIEAACTMKGAICFKYQNDRHINKFPDL